MGERLGQHFLKNTAAITTSIDALRVSPGDTIIEIGPGKGALTLPLLTACEHAGCRLIVIERDAELAAQLKTLMAEQKRSLEIIEGDALVELPKVIAALPKAGGAVKVVGNIPYYITGSLLRIISELTDKPATTVLLIQKEVARRIVAPAGSMNLLAAAVQFWARPKILMILKQKDFDPAPKVMSAIIALEPKTTVNQHEADAYYSFLHIAFKQPRKLLSNNLRDGGVDMQTAQKLLTQLGFDQNVRAQNVSIEQLISLSQLWTQEMQNRAH